MLNHPPPDSPKGHVRHVQILLSFLGMFIGGVQYVTLSVVIVGMKDSPELSLYGPLNYSLTERGTISGMFTYGNMLSALPAGYLASVYKPLLLVSLSNGIICGLVTIAMPYVSYHFGFGATCAARVIQGVLVGFVTPCACSHMSNWVIPQERGKFSWLWAGVPSGCLFGVAVGGVLVARLGWPSLFFFTGAVGVTWGIICFIYGAECPGNHSSISFAERDYIEKNLPIRPKVSVKYLKMFTSVPLWSNLWTHGCDNWSSIILSSLIPTYFHYILNLSVEQTGWLTSMLYGPNIFGGFLFAYIAHKTSRMFSDELSRKLWNSIGLYGTATAVILILFANNNQIAIIVLLVLAFFVSPAKHLGVQTNYHDLAPALVGIISSASVFFANLVGFTGPIFAGLIMNDETDPNEWLKVFGSVAIANILGGTIFLIFGSTKAQPWYENT